MLYSSLHSTSRADTFLCSLCPEPRRAAGWDHCHDHGFIRGPVCAVCNTDEGHSIRFLCREGALAHLLRCRGCREGSVLPKRYRQQAIAAQLRATERHDGCECAPLVMFLDLLPDGGMRCAFECPGHPETPRWEHTMPASEATDVLTAYVEQAKANPGARGTSCLRSSFISRA
ncbi:endonuclease domain-containing protein [Streptomyces sp. RFCAC02]|uniref:endonuclease domain-containing protein n=1 Tax=Streptomyces sp. RFCAC02 TaxID=2499143 RepID=UPI001F0F1B1C|nr:endonuclease domain-containing protein [Streptomyces sp. RFCAC02]